MHGGFQALRQHCPTQFRRPVRKIALTPQVEEDVARIEAAWAKARRAFGQDGPFLFGGFCAADAMFAPVVNRLHTYDVPVGPASREYMNAVMALPAWKAWIADSEAEEWRIEKYESI
jgi:glutathione S-transferase